MADTHKVAYELGYLVQQYMFYSYVCTIEGDEICDGIKNKINNWLKEFPELEYLVPDICKL